MTVKGVGSRSLAVLVATCVVSAFGVATPVLAADSVGVVTEFRTGVTAGSEPWGISAGADGNLWFTEKVGNRIGRITTSGVVTEFSTGITAGSSPFWIAAGPDGNLWFTEMTGNRIGRITTSGVVTEFSTGITAGSDPFGIAAGPDGNLWFTEMTGNRIGRITTSGVVTEFSTGITADSSPLLIAAGPDGNLWFTEMTGNRIGRITTSGVVTEFSTGITAASAPVGIAAGPDGNLWFTGTAAIGRITTTGLVTEFPIDVTREPTDIVAGPDGSMWFTQSSETHSGIGRITTSGVVTDFTEGIAGGSRPMVIARGPDDNLWFTESVGNQIGRIGTRPQAPTVASVSPATGPTSGGTAVTLTGTGFAVGATVRIGGTLASQVVVVSATSITAITPVGSVGAADVTVTNPDTQTGMLVGGFTYTYLPVVPDPPAVVAQPGDASAQVEWAASASNGGPPVIDYTVTATPSGATRTVSGVSVAFTGLTNGMAYAFTVTARNSVGTSKPSPPSATVWPKASPVDVTPPTATMTRPSKVLALTTAVPVGWTGRDVGSGIAGYQVQRAVKAPGLALGAYADWGLLRTATSATMAGAKPGYSYCFRVQSRDRAGNRSPWSAPRCSTLPVDERTLARSSGWTRLVAVKAYLRTVSRSRTVGASLVLPRARGKALALVLTKMPGGGSLGVFVGGKRVALVVTSARRATYQVVVVLRVRTTGLPVVLRVVSPGKAGVTMDGIAQLP